MSRLPQLKIIVFAVVLIFTFILRAHSYEKAPTSNHLDEMLYAWSGINLIETGVPVSWSTLPYPARAQVYKGDVSYKGGDPRASVTLYKPWLDEPPLFSLLVGWFAHINGADRNEFIPSSYIRIPMVLISTLTSIFIFLIAKKIGGFWRGILAMLVYGTVPIMVFASRAALPETLIAFLLTLMIYLFIKFWERPNFWYILPIPILIGIAGLSKPTGYFLLPLALYFTFAKLYKEGKLKIAIRYCLYLGLATIPFVWAYFWYGMYFDAEIFKIIYNVQSHRPVGFGSLAWYFISPSFGTEIIQDGWFVFCLLSAAFFILNAKDDIKRFVTISFVYSVAVVMFTGGEWDLLAWYRFPSYPFLAIMGAWGIEFLVKKANFFTTFLAAGMLLGGRRLLVNAFHPYISPIGYRLVFSGLMLPSILDTVFNKNILRKVSRVIVIGVISIGMAMNAIYIYLAYEVECQSKTCTMVPSTTLSKLGFPFIAKLFYAKR
jgi:4-amino-4-deoxy-L-arabinose transferase-like glycosyltransferase